MVDAPPLRKFMFDRSFDGGAGAQTVERRVPVTLKPEQLDALKKESFDAGFVEGQKAGLDQQTHKLHTAVTHLDARLGELMQHLVHDQQSRDAEIRNAVLAIAKKFLPDMTSRHGLQEIQAMLAEVIAEMAHEPRLVVRVHETEFDSLNSRIAEITAQKAYAGKVVVLADADIAAGDCRVEWADGGIERNVQATWKNIDNAVAPNATPTANSQNH